MLQFVDRTFTGRCFALVTILFGVGLFSGPVLAAQYYVDRNHPLADDANPGNSERPWRTLYRAAKASLVAGDTVFVKPGTYDMSSGGSWSQPAFNPPSSGKPGKPITFQALPRHGAILDSRKNHAPIGTRGRSHVVFDGFVITNPGPKGIAVFGTAASSTVKGVVISNNIIRGVSIAHATDNADGIRLEDAENVIVRNNRIESVRNGNMTDNAAGIKVYRVKDSIVEHNEIVNVGAGIVDKQAGRGNIYRRNLIQRCNASGILVKTKSGQPARGVRIYENVIDRCNKSVDIGQTDAKAVVDDVHVFNNVFANYVETGFSPAKYNTGRAAVWNNIFYRTTAPGAADVFSYNDPIGTVSLMDYNLYVSGSQFLLGRYQTNKHFASLAAWSSTTGLDRNSLVSAPGFVNAAAGDYRLAAGSTAQSAGRSNGRASDPVVSMGAYPRGSGTVGIVAGPDRPAAPQFSVQ